jgi:hypothetical protein
MGQNIFQLQLLRVSLMLPCFLVRKC